MTKEVKESGFVRKGNGLIYPCHPEQSEAIGGICDLASEVKELEFMNKDKQKVTKGWPPERRKAQAERARQRKPWVCSTGPKTQDGKARSSQNAIQHGTRTAAWRELRTALRLQRQALKKIKATMRDRSFDDGTQTIKEKP